MRYFIFFLLIFSNVYGNAPLKNDEMPPVVQRFLQSFGNDITKKYRLQFVSMNEREECCHRSLDLLFDYGGEWDIVKARKMIVGVAQAFRERMRDEPECSPLAGYFCHFPLCLPDFTIRIRHRRENCGFVYPSLNNVSSVLLQDGRIFYETLNSNTFVVNVLRTESFEAAEAMLETDSIELPPGYEALQRSLRK